MLLEPGFLSVSQELTRPDLYLRILVDPPPIVYGVLDLIATRFFRAEQVFKHFGRQLRHLPVLDAEFQRK